MKPERPGHYTRKQISEWWDAIEDAASKAPEVTPFTDEWCAKCGNYTDQCDCKEKDKFPKDKP